jgi:peroxiredoxin
MSRSPTVAAQLFLIVLLLSFPAFAGMPAPAECLPAAPFSGATLSGEPVSLETIRGRKPYAVLTFFGVRCIPCQKKLAQLNELWGNPRFRDKASIYAINADGYSAEKLSEELLRLNIKIDFPVIPDDNQVITNLYVDGIVPLTIVIGSRDELVMSFVGARAEMTRKMADRILSEQEAREK